MAPPSLHNARIVFLGTPVFVIPVLDELINAGATLLCVTAPDALSSHEKQMRRSAVKVYAQEHQLTVVTPKRIADIEEQMRSFNPDIAIVAAYGKIIPESMLAIPRSGFVNVHPSLLPRFRGASPVISTILAGETESGVSIMQMDAHVDTGAVFSEEKISLDGTETSGLLHAKLFQIGASLLVATLPGIFSKTMPAIPQVEAQASYTKKYEKSDAQLHWHQPAIELEKTVRAFSPIPGAWTSLEDGTKFKVLAARVGTLSDADPGTLVAENSNIGVVCGDRNVLLFERVQPAGKKVLTGIDFFHGYSKLLGKSFMC